MSSNNSIKFADWAYCIFLYDSQNIHSYGSSKYFKLCISSKIKYPFKYSEPFLKFILKILLSFLYILTKDV